MPNIENLRLIAALLGLMAMVAIFWLGTTLPATMSPFSIWGAIAAGIIAVWCFYQIGRTAND
jgi:hypothetical protein